MQPCPYPEGWLPHTGCGNSLVELVRLPRAARGWAARGGRLEAGRAARKMCCFQELFVNSMTTSALPSPAWNLGWRICLVVDSTGSSPFAGESLRLSRCRCGVGDVRKSRSRPRTPATEGAVGDCSFGWTSAIGRERRRSGEGDVICSGRVHDGGHAGVWTARRGWASRAAWNWGRFGTAMMRAGASALVSA